MSWFALGLALGFVSGFALTTGAIWAIIAWAEREER